MRPKTPSCPSAPADHQDAVVFGVVGGTVDAPRVGYLTSALPVTGRLLELADPVTPPEVFRFAAPCAASGCRQFDGQRCSIAVRLVSATEPVVDSLPRCAVRSTCRWWAEHGREACLRCPSVVTVDHAPTPAAVTVAGRPGAPDVGG